jgi:hypothetical protein
MQSIGITVEEIAIIYLALPFTTFLAPPITGICIPEPSFAPRKEINFETALLPHLSSLIFINANEWEQLQLRFATQDDQITSI